MKRLLAAFMLASFSHNAFAIDQIYVPYVEKGEWEAEYFGHRSVDDDDTKDNAQGQELSVGYGVTHWWRTELNAIWAREPEEDSEFEALELENVFQLTDRGEYWADFGLALDYAWAPEHNHADEIEARLIAAKKWRESFHVVNLTFEHEVGSGSEGGLGGAFLWSSRYRVTPYFQPGFEVQLESGDIADDITFEENGQYAGPVIYGTIPLGQGLGYRAGYLFGLSDESSDGQALIELEYGLSF